MGELCSTSVVPHTYKVSGASTNPLLEHGNHSSHHEEKQNLAESPLSTLNTKVEELDSIFFFFFLVKIDRDSLTKTFFRCF